MSIIKFWGQIDPEANAHPVDRDVLERVDHGFDLRCLPGPYMGPLCTAPVVLLYLSPGLCQRDIDEASTKAAQQRYVEQRKGRSPMPSPEQHSEAWHWWTSRTKVFGHWEDLQDKISILNISGYHSHTFGDEALLASLPSCRVTLDWAQSVLFPQAIAGERSVVCLRSHRFWGLNQGARYGEALYAPEVVRGGHMKRNNLRSEIIDRVIKRLDGQKTAAK